MSKELNGIYKFFWKRRYGQWVDIPKIEINKVVKEYCKKIHSFSGDICDCANIVQKNFDDFVNFVNRRK